MYLKTAIILAVFAGLYLSLVFVATTWWQALPLAILLGLSMATIGFNIEHDGGHQAYSNYAWINQTNGDDHGSNWRQFLCMALEACGGPSYLCQHHGP